MVKFSCAVRRCRPATSRIPRRRARRSTRRVGITLAISVLIEADGSLKITGRKKDIFNCADGSNIYPGFIELQLENEPYISQAVLLGDRRPFIAALIFPDRQKIAESLNRDIATLSEAEITAALSTPDRAGQRPAGILRADSPDRRGAERVSRRGQKHQSFSQSQSESRTGRGALSTTDRRHLSDGDAGGLN